MRGDEVLATLGRRMRRPAGWASVLFFTGVSAWSASAVWKGHLGSPAGWATAFLVPFSVFGAFAWISPVPWQWTGRPGSRPSFGRGLLQAGFALEGLMALLVLGDCRLKEHLGIPVNRSAILSTNLILFGPLMVVVGSLMAKREAEAADKEEARQRALEAQHRLLQSQLHPHVLYNALNGLAELILKDPPSAERSVRSLSRLLRQLLAASELATVTLADERRLLADYLAIEAMRLGDRLRLTWDWDGRLDGYPVPPMVLQPLVENAIKHGIAPAEEGGTLRISARHEGGRLRLGVWNSGAPLEVGPSGGIGVRNLEARLRLAYGDFARLSLRAEAGGTLAEITVDLEGA